MKTESNVKFILRLALTLLAITAVVAAALAGVNMITAPAIAQLNAQKTQEAIELVLPGGGEIVEDFPATALVSKVYASDSGYAVEVTPGGFDNTITMMVGVDTEGKVLGISVISHTETAGLGAVAAAETPNGIAFREEFVGASAEVSVTKDGGEAIEFPETDLVSKVYASDAGYAVEVTPGGFDNTITMMVGVDTEGKVMGISIISHTETAGLGAVAAAGTPAGEAFRGGFVGKSGSVSVTKDGGEINAITGATITSRAVCAGVNAALECVAQIG